jgi:hypothetical protein
LTVASRLPHVESASETGNGIGIEIEIEIATATETMTDPPGLVEMTTPTMSVSGATEKRNVRGSTAAALNEVAPMMSCPTARIAHRVAGGGLTMTMTGEIPRCDELPTHDSVYSKQLTQPSRE